VIDDGNNATHLRAVLLHETSLLYRRVLILLVRHAWVDLGRVADGWVLRGDLPLHRVIHLLNEVVTEALATARPTAPTEDRTAVILARELRRTRRLLRLSAEAKLVIHATEALVAGDDALHDEGTALAAKDLKAAHHERFERVDLAPALVPAAHVGVLSRILGLPERVLLEPEQEACLGEPVAETMHGEFAYPAAAMATSPLRHATVLVEAADRLFRRVVAVEDVVAADLSTEIAESFGLPEDERVFKRFFPRVHWTDDARTRLCCVLASSIRGFSATSTKLRMAEFAALEACA
jgi:hypothetical protein